MKLAELFSNCQHYAVQQRNLLISKIDMPHFVKVHPTKNATALVTHISLGYITVLRNWSLVGAVVNMQKHRAGLLRMKKSIAAYRLYAIQQKTVCFLTNYPINAIAIDTIFIANYRCT